LNGVVQLYNSTSYNNTLHQPLFLGSNQEISTNSNAGGSVYNVNGYLVDEDYLD
tara:strand:+ start:103 stop:264 length:162 start_codon:yes stop_codon:yes gene_type:complete